MADSKLSALTELAVEPAGTDELYLNDGGVSKRTLWSTIKEAIFSAAERTKLSGIETAADVTDATNVNAAGAVMDTDFGANQIVKADSASTPTGLTVGTQTLVGRITAGVIAALTPAQVRTLINVEDGATADQTNAEIKTAYEANADTNAFDNAAQTKLSGIETAADVTDATNVNTAGAVMETDFNAETILAAAADNTPLPLTVGASTIVGRKATGDIVALTASEARTVAGVVIGTDVQAYDADTLKADTTDTLTVGFQDTANDAGTKTSGTFTPAIADGNLQNATAGGSFTLGVPTGEGIIVLILRNNATGGYTFTTSGWDDVIGVYDSAANAVMVLTLIMDSTGDVLIISDSA